MVVGGAARAHKSCCTDALVAPVISLSHCSSCAVSAHISSCDITARVKMPHLQTQVSRSFKTKGAVRKRRIVVILKHCVCVRQKKKLVVVLLTQYHRKTFRVSPSRSKMKAAIELFSSVCLLLQVFCP